MILAGIEEAGRGPVIGPLVLAIAAIEDDKEENLVNLGVKDSKELTSKEREDLFDKIQDICQTEIVIVWPEEVDKALASPDTNLNWLEADKMVELIDKIKPGKVIVDCPSNNLDAFEKHLRNKLQRVPKEIVVAHKADRDFTIVGAASILAKVTRDREIEKLKKDYGVEFGSGYPSDPTTQKFLKENWDKYPIFRKSWASWKKVSDSKKQKHLGDY